MTACCAPTPLVVGDPRRIGLLAAELVVNRLSARPYALASSHGADADRDVRGSSRACARGTLPSARTTVLQLDEYAGVAPSDTRSMAAQLRGQLDGVPLGSLATIDGGAADLAAEAARHETVVEGAPIDLAVLGLGRDGHVAFDEPPGRVARASALST